MLYSLVTFETADGFEKAIFRESSTADPNATPPLVLRLVLVEASVPSNAMRKSVPVLVEEAVVVPETAVPSFTLQVMAGDQVEAVVTVGVRAVPGPSNGHFATA